MPQILTFLHVAMPIEEKDGTATSSSSPLCYQVLQTHEEGGEKSSDTPLAVHGRAAEKRKDEGGLHAFKSEREYGIIVKEGREGKENSYSGAGSTRERTKRGGRRREESRSVFFFFFC